MGAGHSLSEYDDCLLRKSVTFSINGVNYAAELDKLQDGPSTLLIDFIRDHAGLRGTKYLCREGGCGICVVTAKFKLPGTTQERVVAINSCLVPIYRCDGWEITTVEGLGSVKAGLHPIQSRMVKFGGSQCGFCTPGWIMNMHGMMEENKTLEAKVIEDTLDGNVCRCTGYRAILDAMKSFAVDASEDLRRKAGISCRDCVSCPCSERKAVGRKDSTETFETLEKDNGNIEGDSSPQLLPFRLTFKSGEDWVKATDMKSLFTALGRFVAAGIKYRIVAGNTGTGIYKDEGPFTAYLEINSVPELNRMEQTPMEILFGGAVTISNAIMMLKKFSETTGFEYCKEISKHWSRLANTPIRNMATLAGNLMLKHSYKEFPSDVFLVLEAIGAKLMIASSPNYQQMVFPRDFLRMDMSGKIISAISLPKIRRGYFRCFKVSKRYQNSHAYVNAAFLMQVDPKRKYSVRDKPSIVFGGISPNFVRASATEVFFVGKFLNEKTLQGAMATLEKEINPDHNLPDAHPNYRKTLTQALLYKFCLGIMADQAPAKLKSGGTDLERGVSSGVQSFDTDKSEWPIHEPVLKLEGPIQCTGEAEYINDMRPEYGELHAAFVVTTVANARLKEMDASDAMMVPGVVAFVKSDDIPGVNNYMLSPRWASEIDEIFVSDKVSYAGQPVGVIVAETREIALKSAKLVKITYTDVEKPILEISASLERAKAENSLEEHIEKFVSNCTTGGAPHDGAHTIQGELRTGSQHHFMTEPHTCICIPRETEFDVYSATHWISQVQETVAACLKIPQNMVNVTARRLGGSFGAKLSRSTHVATACAIAANKLQRPVRMVLDIETGMSALGKRSPFLFQYQVSFNDTGEITHLKNNAHCNPGYSTNESTSIPALWGLQSCYKATNWELFAMKFNTNTPPNTYCRAPGVPKGVACTETIMDHIAWMLKKDPLEVRIVNFMEKGDEFPTDPGSVLLDENKLPMMLEEMKTGSDIENRQEFIQNFNKTNRWKKRGMGILPIRYPTHYPGIRYNIFIAVYAEDGTVAVTHCGIEMGQGMNTKIAQVVAKELQIPLNNVRIKQATTVVGANTVATGGSITTEVLCYCAIQASQIIMQKLEPTRKMLDNPSWHTLIQTANSAGVDMTGYYQMSTAEAVGIKPYPVWALCCTEVEIDCLTGENKIIRTDILYDVGLSLNPHVDIGQVEGAFIMGLGLWLTEKCQYHPETGELLTKNTWEYKVPFPKDIPEDFRVSFLKNSRNSCGVLASKATAEAPFLMSFSVVMAMRQAITSARSDAGNEEWFEIHTPLTVEDTQMLCLSTSDQFHLKSD